MGSGIVSPPWSVASEADRSPSVGSRGLGIPVSLYLALSIPTGNAPSKLRIERETILPKSTLWLGAATDWTKSLPRRPDRRRQFYSWNRLRTSFASRSN